MSTTKLFLATSQEELYSIIKAPFQFQVWAQ